jgi:serine/threonine-protein kinase
MDLFTEIMGLSSGERVALLQAECSGDPDLYARVEELLAHHKEVEERDFLEPSLLLPLPPREALPQLFGNYELLGVIGVGGQGVVYRARQVHIDKEVALKLVNPRDRCRSLRELKIASNLEHEHLIRVNHVGEHANQLYFTMKLAENGNLENQIEEYSLPKALPITAAERAAVEDRKKKIASFMAKIARAFHYIHEQGTIHRDPKPRNILLGVQGEPLVSDFGLARRVRDTTAERAETGPSTYEQGKENASGTREGAILGTPGFMAPEQAQGRTDLTPAVDVFGLGAIIYVLLTGRTPFVGTDQEIIDQTADMEHVPPCPSLCNPNVVKDSDLELICLRCLEKEPARRYATAAELAEDLDCYLRNERTSVRPQGILERTLRALVAAVNHKLPIRGIARWGAIDLWDAGLNLALGIALFLLIRTDQPPALLWLALLSFDLVWFWMFLTFLFRHQPLEPAEQHLALLWSGVSVAGLTLFAIYCPPFGTARAVDLLAFFPPWAVVNGVGFLVVGRLYWGWYYLVGLAHFLLAILMPLRLDFAPLIYGVFVAVCMAYGAWDHFRSGRRENLQS